ncbi:MAG: type III polyketide synthase [Verrucomicrobiales bacterium]
MFLLSIASAFPEQSYTQAECADLARQSRFARENLSPNSHHLLESILGGDSGISKRHFAVDDLPGVFDLDAGQLNREFERHAPALASRALTAALENADTPADTLDAVFVCTCTGYLCPGVSSHIAEQLGLRPDTVLHDLVGLGCGAAIPTLRSASNFLSANPDATVAVVAVEICSAAFYMSNDPGVLISLCLFGDGASASLWTGRENGRSRLHCHGFRSQHLPSEREKIRFVNDTGKLKNKLHRSVPLIAAETVESMHDGAPPNTNASIPRRALTHSGGRDVIAEIRKRLPQYDLTETAHVLDQWGNLSSPSVLVALEHYLDSSRPTGAENLFLASFGAGFSCHTCWAET